MTQRPCARIMPGMTEIHLDNRGLEPPEPMVRILEAISGLAQDARLVVLMDREPLMLYPELERRGFAWTFDDGAKPVLTVTRVPRE